MCYAALVDGDVHSVPLRRLIRGESRNALTDGLVAATVVLVVGLVAGTPVRATAVGTVAAVPSGFVVHQIVLVVGVLLLRFGVPHTDERAECS